MATAHSDFSDALALKVISDIDDCPVDCYNGDKDAPGKMHITHS